MQVQIDAMRRYVDEGYTLPIIERIQALQRLRRAVKAHEQDIYQALHADFHKPKMEVYTTELMLCYSEIDGMCSHLHRFSKPKRVSASLMNQPGSGKIHYHPYGVVLIMSPWNYPFQLTMMPLIGALAAGNAAVVKPSDYAMHTGDIIQRIIEESFASSHVICVRGGRAANQMLLDLSFDFIFFTGSTTVGRLVMEKASKHVTPVVLELGGKSPCFVSKNANLDVAAKRIVWGKFLNGGQTCVAPDYVMAEDCIHDILLARILHYIQEFYYEKHELRSEFPAIINDTHCARLLALIHPDTKGAYFTVCCGGKQLPGTRLLEPTVISGVTFADAVMQEEIFGPVLPLLRYHSLEETIGQIRTMPHPLALYCFSENRAELAQMMRIQSGGACINDTVMHVGEKHLPFGGLGQSGMGSYHGYKSFTTFSHARSVLYKPTVIDVPLRYPPYTEQKWRWVKRLLRK